MEKKPTVREIARFIGWLLISILICTIVFGSTFAVGVAYGGYRECLAIGLCADAEPTPTITSAPGVGIGLVPPPTLGPIDFAPAYADIILPAIDALQAQLMQWDQQMSALALDPRLVLDEDWRWGVYDPLIEIASTCNRLNDFRTPDLYAESRGEISIFCEQAGDAGGRMYAGIQALDATFFDDGYRLMAVARQHLDLAVDLLPDTSHEEGHDD